MKKPEIIGHDYGSAKVEGLPNRHEPYVAIAKSNGEVDFMILREETTESAALAAAEFEYKRVVAAFEQEKRADA